MPPLSLTETQHLAIETAAHALHPQDRDQFYMAVAALLQGCVIGDGAVGRAIRVAQSQFIRPEPERQPPRWAR
jgi:hypothetical protein